MWADSATEHTQCVAPPSHSPFISFCCWFLFLSTEYNKSIIEIAGVWCEWFLTLKYILKFANSNSIRKENLFELNWILKYSYLNYQASLIIIFTEVRRKWYKWIRIVLLLEVFLEGFQNSYSDKSGLMV